jgi:putative transposase
MLLHARLDTPPEETVYIAWGKTSTHEDDAVAAVMRGAAGRLVLRSLPTYSPWHNPIKMLWRHFRCAWFSGEFFEHIKALIAATQAFFEQQNQSPKRALSIIGVIPKEFLHLY